jgi:hypothetical protein
VDGCVCVELTAAGADIGWGGRAASGDRFKGLDGLRGSRAGRSRARVCD